jgi:Spy/CpxP family protein refolding chaperone
MSQPVNNRLSRRTLFAGAGAAGAVAAAASLVATQPEVQPAAAAPKAPPEKGGGYSLTEHVKRYYKTTLV